MPASSWGYRTSGCNSSYRLDSNRAARSFAASLTDYDVPVELLDARCSDPEELVATLGAQAH